jgi:hypothetical protein
MGFTPKGGLMAVPVITQGMSYESVCELPCSPSRGSLSGDELFFGGTDLPQSSTFRIREVREGQRIQVSGGSMGQRIGGALLMGFGVVGVITGATVGAVTAALGTDKAPSANVPVTVGSLVTGIPSLIGGIVLLRNGATRYTFVDARSFALRF